MSVKELEELVELLQDDIRFIAQQRPHTLKRDYPNLDWAIQIAIDRIDPPGKLS